MSRRDGPRAACFGAVRCSSVLRMIPAPVGEAAIHEGSTGAGGAGAGSGVVALAVARAASAFSAGVGGGGVGREELRNRHMVYGAMESRAFSLFTRWLSIPNGLSKTGASVYLLEDVTDSIVPNPPGRVILC